MQNKLHRNAGPEDLVATEEMLARVSAPDVGYSPDFVNEFRVFTGELRDFFNAGSLGDLLVALRPSLDDSGSQVLAPPAMLGDHPPHPIVFWPASSHIRPP